MLDCIDFPHFLNIAVLVVFMCALFCGLALLFSNRPDAIARFKCVKEIMIMFLGMVGIIIGFYMRK